MELTELHSTLLAKTLEKLLDQPEEGSIAFVRCLAPEVVQALAANPNFAPEGWTVYRVADVYDQKLRTITAGQAVELREDKAEPLVLLVDPTKAGAGMDGIYSAAKELSEAALFREAIRLAGQAVTKRYSSWEARRSAERALQKAKGHGNIHGVSPWAEFDFLARVAQGDRSPGELLPRIGLWPVESADEAALTVHDLDLSRLFVDRLLGAMVAGQPAGRRVEALKLSGATKEQKEDLQRFLHETASLGAREALERLNDRRQLWIGPLKVEEAPETATGLELISWRGAGGRLLKWSGLVESSDGESSVPVLVLDPNAEETGNYSKLEIRWKAKPENLAKRAAEYQVAILTDMEEELAGPFRVLHGAKRHESHRFSDDDFGVLSEDSLISAKVVVSVAGAEKDERDAEENALIAESEEFQIRFGEPPARTSSGVGKTFRRAVDGLIELADRDRITALASSTEPIDVDGKGFLNIRTPPPVKSYRVYAPPLIQEIDRRWADEHKGAPGRWRVRVRTSGERVGEAEFVPIEPPEGAGSDWSRVEAAGAKLAERFKLRGGCGQIYDQAAKSFDVAREYLLAWAKLLDSGAPELALANTVEAVSLSGRTIGLIVLPSHPIRVAWHAAYDNLLLHVAFESSPKPKPKQIREEFAALDGAMFPAFLPGLEPGRSFVFADTLGVNAVGMVIDDDEEPKAAISILSRALSDSSATDAAPTVGRQSAEILGREIRKYLDCHIRAPITRIHALRPGDGMTVARALGGVEYPRDGERSETEGDEGAEPDEPTFELELYPSQDQVAVTGRFIAEARERRRAGAGDLSMKDRWMLESVSRPGGLYAPRLRWARKSPGEPQNAAHLAVAFDTFDSRVAVESAEELGKRRPLFAHGLMSFFEREYASLPSPIWRGRIPEAGDGEKHPSDRAHTDRLARIQRSLQRLSADHLGDGGGAPVLRTEIPAEKAHNLKRLHQLCDWVITLDRNAGVEYFDSPRDNPDIYDAYVIDCVPEREDLGCLQLITSTSSLDEVRGLLDRALDQMGLSRSRRNAEFLMERLKALSGRLAIRLTGQSAPTSELIALALANARAHVDLGDDPDGCWPPRDGYLIPVDDVQDLLPPVDPTGSNKKDDKADRRVRPDLIHVSRAPRSGLLFRFIEVKYRRNLGDARSSETLNAVREQVESLRKRWSKHYGGEGEDVPPSFLAVRRAKLARVLRFYADKARRHADDETGEGLSAKAHADLIVEIDKMIERGSEFTIATGESIDRGWVFCPEYLGGEPTEISPPDWSTRIFLFGPQRLPDGPGPDNPGPDGRTRETSPTPPPKPAPVASPRAGPEPTAIANQGDDGESEKPEASRPGSSTANGQPKAGRPPSVLLGTDLYSQAEVSWPLSIKGNPHLLIAGLPGMGKTTCLLNLCGQMIAGGVNPIVFSFHEDIDDRLVERHDKVRFLDFDGLGFNPLEVINRGSRRGHLDVAGEIRDIFSAIYPDLGDIQLGSIRDAVRDSFIEQGWRDASKEDRRTIREPPFGRFLEILKSHPQPDSGRRRLLVRLGELEDYGFFDADEDSESLWEASEPIVVRVHTTGNDVLQRAFASIVFYKLYKDMFRRGAQDRVTHALIFDEAHRAAKLELIPTMAKECRKFGIALVIASQEARDFHPSLFSAIANYLILRVTEADAKALVRNVATSELERKLIDRIKQISKYKALYFSERSKRPNFVALRP